MPIPKRKEGEDRSDFLSRCMSDSTMNKEYPENSQRYAVCQQSAKGTRGQQVQDLHYEQTFGSTEELTEDNFVVPNEEDYVSADEVFFEESEIEEFDISVAKPGLWENIRKKKEREGKKYRPAKPGDKDRPSKEAWKKAQSVKEYKYRDPKTGEIYIYDKPGAYKKDGRYLIKAAEYQGRKVTLNKPFRTSNGPKKFAVYTKNEKGNVVIVRFGDPNMKIKKNIPERRKSFRARHNCDNPGPKWKARYWSCKAW